MLIRANRGKKFSEEVGRWSGSVLQDFSLHVKRKKRKKTPMNTVLKKELTAAALLRKIPDFLTVTAFFLNYEG